MKIKNQWVIDASGLYIQDISDTLFVTHLQEGHTQVAGLMDMPES